MKDAEAIILMTDLAADYDKLADRAAAKTATNADELATLMAAVPALLPRPDAKGRRALSAAG